MKDTACCAHSRVVLKHHDHLGGTRSDYWECDSGCGKKFWPETNHKPAQISGLFEAMSLHDYFAGQALVGLLSNPEVGGLNGPPTPQIAGWAYDFANALLQQRAKTEV